ncbi:MAG: 23S rRNA (adenine(2503)-C(2))-methyltransferase RlmN [Ignavibacteriae bacterium]|nr:23S rRNA (adenine(2503)-C(2))-methyltransferase RlmN [Ignavibacteriota bacterium]
MKKNNLIGFTLNELEAFALSLGEKKYRGKQLFDWLYVKEANSFDEMTSLSKQVRESLFSHAELKRIRLADIQVSSADKTTKYLFELFDGKRIESVLIPPKIAFQNSEAKEEEEQQRLTLCISTQAGCPLDCKFCATASMGFLRNVTAGEIVDQIFQVKTHSGKQITNVVYMGMGEPMLNYDNVMKSTEIITTGMGIAARRVTISTAGWVPGIKQMADEKRKVKLAVSLHSLDDAVRTAIMPINKKYSLGETLRAVEYYYQKTKIRVTFEYILFKGINDRDEDAVKLIKLSKRIPSKMNIIPFHSIPSVAQHELHSTLRPSSKKRIDDFVELLRKQNVTVFVRSSAGEDIDAACGQLAVWHEQKINHASLVQAHQLKVA